VCMIKCLNSKTAEQILMKFGIGHLQRKFTLFFSWGVYPGPMYPLFYLELKLKFIIFIKYVQVFKDLVCNVKCIYLIKIYFVGNIFRYYVYLMKS